MMELHLVGAGLAGCGALICLCLPGLVEAFFEPFLQRDGGLPRQEPAIPSAHLRGLLAGPLAVGAFLDMSKGSRTALVPMVAIMILSILKPDYKTLDRILLVMGFVCFPTVSTVGELAPESLAIGWRGSTGMLSSWHYVPVLVLNSMACLLYSRISRVLAVSLAANAVVLCANPTMHKISIPLTLVCTAVSGLKASYNNNHQLAITRLILIFWAMVSVLVVATDMTNLYPDLHLFIVQNPNAVQALVCAAAFGASLVCLVCSDAVDQVLEPILGKHVKDAEQRDLSVRVFFWLLATITPLAAAYQWCAVATPHTLKSAGRYQEQFVSAAPPLLVFVLLMRIKRTYTNYDRLLRFVILCLGPLMRILGLVLAKMDTKQYQLPMHQYRIPMLVFPLVHMVLYSSHARPLGRMLFFTGLISTRTELPSDIMCCAFMTLLTSLVVAAKVMTQQNLALVRAQERLDDRDKIRKRCCHKLRSPLAALDLEARLIETDEAATPELAKKVASLHTCMAAVLESLDDLMNKFDEDPRFDEDSVAQTCSEQPTTKLPEPVRKHGCSAQGYDPGTRVVVMVVDDVACLRNVQMRHLQKLATRWDQDFEYVEATTGEECLMRVMRTHGQPIHAVIMDQYMQDAGGQLLGSEATLKLRQCGFRGLIIGWSGNAESEPLFMHAGADDFWPKPIPPDDAMVHLFESKLGLSRRSLSQGPMQQAPGTPDPYPRQQAQLHGENAHNPGMTREKWCEFLNLCVLPEYQAAMESFRSAPSKDQAHKVKNIAGALFLCDAHYEARALENLCLEQENPDPTELAARASRLDSLMQQSIQSLLEGPGPPGVQESERFRDYMMRSTNHNTTNTRSGEGHGEATLRRRTTIGTKLANKHGFKISPYTHNR